MPVSPELRRRAAKALSRYDAETRDAMYRHVWHLHVMDDVRSHARDMGLAINEDLVGFAAEIYVYEGEYDCNLDYWSNIENAVRLAMERSG